MAKNDTRVGAFLLPVLLIIVTAGCAEKDAGLIACVSDGDCPSGMGCDGCMCLPRCTTNKDCAEGLACTSGFCRSPCLADTDCSPGTFCMNGWCACALKTDGGVDADADIDHCTDQDRDGFGLDCQLGADCDDTNALVHPGAREICKDGNDNDCDGATDEDDCGCVRGETAACYTGPVGTQGKGICRSGVMVCGDNREFGPCQGDRLPQVESCDSIDNNCDGFTDEGLLNRCGTCSPADSQLVEVCGDGLDNDCNAQVDESCSCDPNCQCDQAGAGSNCSCHPPVKQPCYSGPLPTLGVGICKGGEHDCVQQGANFVWTSCAGEVLPGAECVGGSDGKDNDCDGAVDEDCLTDSDGDGVVPPLDCAEGNAAIHPGAQEVCNGADDDCNGLLDDGVTNACGGCGETPAEVCDDSLDNDCDGYVDEECSACSGTETKPCYRGPVGTQGVGQCAFGSMSCQDGEFWSDCQGDVLPQPEVCDGADNDCDQQIDEKWAIGSNACGECVSLEECDGIDNNCDGLTDEGLRNACGDCLPVADETICDDVDNDCDGLTDEGLRNACGSCSADPCYQISWNTPGHCEEDLRLCAGTIPDPANPDAVTLGQGTQRTPFIYIAVYSANKIAKLDTETGQRLWLVPSHGTAPSRTAVALDSSVWVGNRGFEAPSNPDYSNGVHLDIDGNLVCTVDATGIARGVAIDGDGNVWIGTFDSQKLYKVHGSEVNNTDCHRPPCCKVLGTVNVGVSVYGLAIDGNGFLWTASVPTVKVNTATMQIAATVSHPTYYGIAIDRNNDVWFGNNPVHRVGGNAPHTIFQTSVTTCYGVTVHPDGSIFCSSLSTNEMIKIEPNSGQVACRSPVFGGSSPHGVAVDHNGKVWVPNMSGGYVNRYLADCTHDGTFEVDAGQSLYTYSDMTGMQLQLITDREGHWLQTFDSGYGEPIWHSATWQASIPANTSVSLSFVSADTEAGLAAAGATRCGPFTNQPADLLACQPLQRHRWIQADVQLNTQQNGIRPSFSGLTVFWSR